MCDFVASCIATPELLLIYDSCYSFIRSKPSIKSNEFKLMVGGGSDILVTCIYVYVHSN